MRVLAAILVLSSVNASANTTSPAVVGLRKAFATAYQSCESLNQPPLNRSSPKVEGVKNDGFYPKSWRGHYVKITDINALVRTHYYIREAKPAPGCVNVQENPMIYDFGGKPNTSKEAVLDYWKNSPGGSKGLGIDCSGFVFTALAVGGLRLREGETLKASQVNNYPAKSYVHPEKSGFSCLAPKTMGVSGTLKPGDILASNYHIAMIDSVGVDPFGLKKHADCSEITYRDFDFVIAQSSPDKNNIGINKFEGREYLGSFLRIFFRWGLERYARAACEAQQKGTDVVTEVGYFGVSEPKLTPECRQEPIWLQGESCIRACPELYK